MAVDSLPNEPGPSTLPASSQPVPAPSTSSTTAQSPTEERATRSKSGVAVGTRLRLSVSSGPAGSSSKDAEGRTTRSSTAKPKAPTKLKLKLGDKLAAQAPGMSFLGPYDRELDSDDEEIAFEEHFILRMPPGDDCEKLKDSVQKRAVGQDVWFKFKDSRRGHFHIGNTTYSTKLVDLPCILESQKTLDNKQMFKVADICQMLLVEKPVKPDDAGPSQKSFNIEEFIYPHGLTPPLKHVRKRRFRKRVNRRQIESVEKEVERLLDEDTLAEDVQYEILENVNPDLSDSEFIEREETVDPTAASDMGDAATPAPPADQDSSSDDGGIDEELAAALDEALEDDDSNASSNESGDDESGDDDIDSGDEEQSQARKLLSDEIRDLENAVAKKEKEVASTTNALIKKRFEDTLKKLAADLDAKRAQRDALDEKTRMEREGISDPTSTAGQEGGDQSGDDLFGDDNMEVDEAEATPI
ncbi:TAFII55 protein conserved region-domain-containing protein [Flagelloscypha sp. PMI_526]|nr:TAFII55 protein conserved region-domain-containing protein [Flagelloscypha sp. PMI_526]